MKMVDGELNLERVWSILMARGEMRGEMERED